MNNNNKSNTLQVQTPPPKNKKQASAPSSNPSSASATKRSSSSSSAMSDDLFLYRSMVHHDILTKKQELELGRSVQRSLELQEELDLLLEQKRHEQQQQQQQLQSQPDDEEEEGDDLSDEEELLNLSVYGGGGGVYGSSDYNDRYEEDPQSRVDQEVRSYLAREEALYQERESGSLLSHDSFSTDLDEEEPHDLASDTAAAALLFDSNDATDETATVLKDLHLLTDQDVMDHLKLPGGKSQLQHILIQGARARETLIRSNIKLVVGICKKWSRMTAGQAADLGGGSGSNSLHAIYNGGWDRPAVNEAVQEGILGLIKAVERYDPSRGLRFSTYATYWVTNSVRTCFQRATTGVFRVPTNYYEVRSKYKKLVKQHFDESGQVPPLEDLAADLGLAVPRLKTMLRLTRPLLSMDAPLQQGGGGGRAGKAGGEMANDNSGGLLISDTIPDVEQLPPEDAVELSFLRQCLENAMATELAPHERDVLRLRLGLDDGVSRTCRQVALEGFGGSLTSQEVRLAEKRAFRKLRSPHSLATYKFLHYLDFCNVDRETMTFR